jgi:predicted dinucleotide-binding enzyme
MQIGIFGTGMVGQAIGSKLPSLGHSVLLGARETNNDKGQGWAARSGGRSGTFSDAATHGEIVFNCTLGSAALDVVQRAGYENLAGKILVDVANPLDFSKGSPPTLSIINTDSLGETLQRTLPATKVIKTLNTVNCEVMVDPARVPGRHSIFICGNDAAAKARVTTLLESFGWRDILDLGDITAARTTEQLMPIWLRLWGTLKTADFNFAIVR